LVLVGVRTVDPTFCTGHRFPFRITSSHPTFFSCRAPQDSLSAADGTLLPPKFHTFARIGEFLRFTMGFSTPMVLNELSHLKAFRSFGGGNNFPIFPTSVFFCGTRFRLFFFCPPRLWDTLLSCGQITWKSPPIRGPMIAVDPTSSERDVELFSRSGSCAVNRCFRCTLTRGASFKDPPPWVWRGVSPSFRIPRCPFFLQE